MENLNIIQEIENALYKRKEIKATIKAEITPNLKEIKEILTKKFSTQPEAIVTKGIYGEFGSKEFKINANIYETIEDRKRIEPFSKKELEVKKQAKVAEEEAKKPVEVPKENIKEEKPAEEVPNTLKDTSEESKAEEKKEEVKEDKLKEKTE